MEKRLDSIDVIKGIAIILVVFGHMLSLAINISPSFKVCYDIIYGFHMAIFFIVAGIFVQKWSSLYFKAAFIQKFCRLMIPYFTWGFLFSIYKSIGGQYAVEQEGFSAFLTSVWKPWNIFWFVYVLFFIHIIFYFVVHISKNYIKGRALFLKISILTYILGAFVPDFWIIRLLCKYMLFFAIGTYLLESLKKKILLSKYNSIFSVILFIIVNVIYLKLIQYGNDTYLHFYGLITAGSGFLLLVVLTEIILHCHGIISTVFCFLGRKSLEIYVLHPFLIGMGKFLSKKFLGNDFLWGQVILCSLFTLVVCGTVWKFIGTNNKFYRMMFGIVKRT